MQQLITNDSFAQRPAGTSSFQSVRMDLRWTQFFRFRPVAGKTVQGDPGCLDLERFLRRDDVDIDVDQVDEQAVQQQRRRPRSFGSLHAFEADRSLCYMSQEMPIAVIGFRNAAEKKALADKGDRRARSKSCGYSFLGGVTFNKLLQAYRCMDPNDMCMGAVVLENTPAHLYFDFDAGLSTREDRQLGAAQALAIKVQGREVCDLLPASLPPRTELDRLALGDGERSCQWQILTTRAPDHRGVCGCAAHASVHVRLPRVRERSAAQGKH